METESFIEKDIEFSIPPATYNGESVSDLMSEYAYNIVILVLFLYIVAFINEFVMFMGFYKGWAHWKETDISHFSKTFFPVPETIETKIDLLKKHGQKILLIYRIIIVLFCIFVWFWTLFVDSEGSLFDFFSFYTIWNFSMLICFFACSILLTIFDMINFKPSKLILILGNFTNIIYNIEIALVFLVDSVVWLILLPILSSEGKTYLILTFSSSIVHGMNLIFMMIDFGFNRIPIRLFNMTWMVCWALVYIFWAMVYYSLTYKWRYPFLNLWTPTAMIWYGLVFSMHFVFFFLCYGLYRLKMKLGKKFIRNFDGEIINIQESDKYYDNEDIEYS